MDMNVGHTLNSTLEKKIDHISFFFVLCFYFYQAITINENKAVSMRILVSLFFVSMHAFMCTISNRFVMAKN